MRQDAKKKRANVSRKGRIHTEIKKIERYVEQDEKEKALEQIKVVFKVLDKAAKQNIIHKNKASRKKSQVAKMVNQLTAKALSVLTGKKYSAKKLNAIGKKIVDLERRLDVMRGLKKSDDSLPERIINEQTIIKGRKIKVGKENFDRMKRDFYRIRGW